MSKTMKIAMRKEFEILFPNLSISIIVQIMFESLTEKLSKTLGI